MAFIGTAKWRNVVLTFFFLILGEGGIKSDFVITKPDTEYLILEGWESGSGNHGKEKDILIFHSNLSNDSTAHIRQRKGYYYFE